MNILFKQASEQIVQLKTTETWKLDLHLKQGTISQLVIYKLYLYNYININIIIYKLFLLTMYIHVY